LAVENLANLDSMGAIPYGWDYTCDKDVDGCKGMWKSFNIATSTEISGPLLARIDKLNFMNSDLAIRGMRRDSIGLGLSKDKMMKFRMGEVDVIGLICSSNEMEHDTRNYAMNLLCDTKIYANPKFDGIPSS